MKRSGQSRDPESKMRRKLEKAQATLRRSQEKRLLVAAKGEEEVEKASRRAASRLNKATLRVEQKAGEVTRIESRLHALKSKLAQLSSGVDREQVGANGSEREKRESSACWWAV
jgi:hypothetical protein